MATETAGMGLPTRWHHAYTTDFNGDGKTDLLIQSGDGLGWEKAISNGINFNYSTFSFTHLPKIEGVNTWWSPERDNISIGDFNGDSKSDIIHIRGNGTNQIYTYLSRGNTFEIKQTNSWTSRPVHMATYVSDINGDGVTDVLSISTSNTVSNENYPNILFYYKNTKHPMLEKAADGLANVTRFEYQPLSSGVNYQKGTGLSYPFVDIQPAFYVVQRMFQPDGLGSSIQTNYNYEGAFAHLEGRGLLGFKKFITHNLSTGMKSETIADFDSNYDVSYVKEVNAYNAIANQQISHTVNNIAFVQGTVPTQSNAPGSFYQQLTSQTQQNLLTSSTTTTTNTYNNNYGTISFVGFGK